MNSKELIEEFEKIENKDNGRNIMGCDENWYNPIWAIGQTFTKQEIEQMTEKEINNLIKLGDNISEGLY